MPIKSDQWIRRLSLEKGMIEPFEPKQIRHGISFGLSSYGYDFRLGPVFKLYQPGAETVIDPKNFATLHWEEKRGDYLDIPAGSFCLGQSIEYFRIPRNILTIAFGKSTYARCGVLVNVTPFEPEWEGFVTLGITNTTSVPVKIYAHEGIAQVLFLESDEVCAVSYQDRQGHYQAQQSITFSKVK